MRETLLLLRPEDYVTTQWSGGTTTQLTIAPSGAVYADRDFLWRISSAAVSVKESDFTALPDYHRLISVLKGEMTLAHNGGESFTLHPYEVHEFEGSDNTHSWGQCTDFNLMLRRGQADGTMETRRLFAESEIYHPAPQAEQILLYCAAGSCGIVCQGETLVIHSGESLLVRQVDGGDMTLKSEGHAQLMICQMWRV